MYKQISRTRLLYVISILLIMMILTICFMPNGLYGKYMSSDKGNDGTTVAPFVPQFKIIDSSQLSFSNVSAELNGPRDTTFQISNYTNDVVTAVTTKYSLVFYIPSNTFGKTAMFQLMTGTESHEATPLTPLYDVIDLSSGKEHTTENNRYKNYITINDEKLSPKEGEIGTYVVTSIDGNVPCGTINIETVNIETEYYLLFGFWSKDSSLLLDPTLKVSFKTKMDYYKITINRPEFILSPGMKEDDNMILRLIPKVGMTEESNPIDEELHTAWSDLENKITDYTTQLSIIDYDMTLEKWEVIYNGHNNVSIQRTSLKNGVVERYDNVLIGHSKELSDGTTQRISSGKGYPCRLNAIFEQIN